MLERSLHRFRLRWMRKRFAPPWRQLAADRAARRRHPGSLPRLGLYRDFRRRACGNCGSWRPVSHRLGACWSPDRLGDAWPSRSPASFTWRTQVCEAWGRARAWPTSKGRA